jgi:hypothetical protein
MGTKKAKKKNKRTKKTASDEKTKVVKKTRKKKKASKKSDSKWQAGVFARYTGQERIGSGSIPVLTTFGKGIMLTVLGKENKGEVYCKHPIKGRGKIPVKDLAIVTEEVYKNWLLEYTYEQEVKKQTGPRKPATKTILPDYNYGQPYMLFTAFQCSGFAGGIVKSLTACMKCWDGKSKKHQEIVRTCAVCQILHGYPGGSVVDPVNGGVTLPSTENEDLQESQEKTIKALRIDKQVLEELGILKAKKKKKKKKGKKKK